LQRKPASPDLDVALHETGRQTELNAVLMQDCCTKLGAVMDIDRARTFLEIVHSGSFLRAADRLHVTQTTVSARIRTLEEELGRQLFIRNRN
jgi:LysR family transcriptional regulator, flagellar master operon regulator